MTRKTFKDSLLAEVLDYYRIEPMLGPYEGDDDDDMYDEDMSEYDDFGEEYDDYPDTEDDDMSEYDDFDEEDDDYPDTEDDDMSEFGEDEFEGEENPDRAGAIRLVRGAYLVYKRVTPNNNYEELWVYNLGNINYQTKIRNAILAGTDIDPTTLMSPDGEQVGKVTTAGNVQYLHIDGLPN